MSEAGETGERWGGAWLFGAAAAGGMALAFWQTLITPPFLSDSPAFSNAVAEVNGEAIARADYDALLAALAQERRAPLNDEEKRRLLDNFIDEALLLQRARSLGLDRSDRSVRATLARSMIEFIIGSAEAEEAPSAADLRAFYEENLEIFQGGARYHLRVLYLSPENADRIKDVEAALRARGFDEARRAYGDPRLPELPDTPLPPSAIGYYLGGDILPIATALQTSETSAPYRETDGGTLFLHMISRQEAAARPFEEMREDVFLEWRKRRDGERLRAYIKDLRDEASIRIMLDAPAP